MKRSGFTMIELIFVIVILGILAAVALPKFIGVSEQATLGKLKGYAGTMTRTTLPPYWGAHLSDGTNGVLTASDMTSAIRDLPMPSGLTTGSDGSLFLVGNLEPSTFEFVTAAGVHTAPTATAMSTLVVDGVTYSLYCRQGGTQQAPACNVYDSDSTRWLLQ